MTDGIAAENDFFKVVTYASKEGVVYPAGQSLETTYTANPVVRRFHAIFKGITLNECVGGCAFELKSTTPERWLTAALADTQILYVERDGLYRGFIQLLPLKHATGIYASVDFSASVLRNKVVDIDSVSGESHSAYLWERWLQAVLPILPEGWKGLVLSQSDAIMNAGVTAEVKKAPAYIHGTDIGDTKEFRIEDPLAEKIVDTSLTVARQGRIVKKYRGRMVADGTVPDAGTLRLLVPEITPPGWACEGALQH